MRNWYHILLLKGDLHGITASMKLGLSRTFPLAAAMTANLSRRVVANNNALDLYLYSGYWANIYDDDIEMVIPDQACPEECVKGINNIEESCDCYQTRSFSIQGTCVNSERQTTVDKTQVCRQQFDDDSCETALPESMRCQQEGVFYSHSFFRGTFMVTIFPGYCIASSTPVDDFVVPFIKQERHHFNDPHCDEPGFVTYTPSRQSICFQTFRPVGDLQTERKSFRQYCNRDEIVFQDFDDEKCAVLIAVNSTRTYRPGACTPHPYSSVLHNTYNCSAPVFHCKSIASSVGFESSSGTRPWSTPAASLLSLVATAAVGWTLSFLVCI